MSLKSFNPIKDYLFPRYIQDMLYFPFLIALAIIVTKSPINLSTLIAIVVNTLGTIFAFWINDIEDREDDAKSPGKRFLNPFGYKYWSLTFAWTILIVISTLTLGLSLMFNGFLPFIIALSILLTGGLYSWRKLRLKSIPIIDVLTHTYFFGTSTILYFALLPNSTWNIATWLALLGSFFVSSYSDLNNEYRDFEDDRKAKLNNSALYLGKNNTIKLAYTLLIAGSVSILVGLVFQIYK